MRILSRMPACALVMCALAPSTIYGQSKSGTGQLISKLSGTWREDPGKRKIGSGAFLQFRTTAAGGLEELRGPESKPMVQPVKLDGKSYNMESGNTMMWKQIDSNTYERRTGLNGKQLSVRRIRISDDGKTLTEEFERTSLDGKTITRKAEYRRTSGEGKGLAGTWRLHSARDSQPAEITYEPMGENAVKVTNSMGQSYKLTFDGKSSPITGASVIPNMVISAKQIDENTMETTSAREGVTAAKSRTVLSQGGKVMTITTTGVGPESSREPGVAVFVKQ